MHGNILFVRTVVVPDLRIFSALLRLMYRGMPNPSVVMRTAFGAFQGIFQAVISNLHKTNRATFPESATVPGNSYHFLVYKYFHKSRKYPLHHVPPIRFIKLFDVLYVNPFDVYRHLPAIGNVKYPVQ